MESERQESYQCPHLALKYQIFNKAISKFPKARLRSVNKYYQKINRDGPGSAWSEQDLKTVVKQQSTRRNLATETAGEPFE